MCAILVNTSRERILMTSVTPSPAPSTTRGDDARARLLRGALAEFSSKGFHGTTTRDIASAAGMSPAAVYVHYRSKEDLLFLLSKQGHEQSLEIVTTAVADSPAPREQLRAFVRGHTIWHARSHTLARIVNYEMAALKPEHYEEIAAIRNQIEGLVRSIVEAGVAGGQFTATTPHMNALALLSLGIDVARWYREDGSWSPEEIADHYVELSLRMVDYRQPSDLQHPTTV